MKSLSKKLHTPTWLFVLLLVVLILRIPSFFEPYSYGDETIYLTLGEAVRRGIPLYKGIHDNKPPLLYLMAAVAGSLFWFKAILAIWHLITVFLFWKLSETLIPKNKKFQIISTVLFALFTTFPLLEGNIANAEMFMIGPTIGAFLILLKLKTNFKNIFIAGFLFSVAALFKIPAAFDLFAIVFLWLVTIKKFNTKSLKKLVAKTFYLLFGFATPIVLTFVWYGLQGAFHEYLVAAFLQNVGYLSSWRPETTQAPFIVRNAPLLLRTGVVAVGLLVLFIKRKKLSKQFIFTTAWLLLTLFAVTLSERPYPHYLIQSVAPMSILAAMLFTLGNIEQVLVIIPLTLAFLVPVYYHFWYYKTTPYYVRFYKFATSQMSKDAYIASFGDRVPRAYKIADFIVKNTKVKDKVFVWGPDSSVIYALSRRFPPGKYVADYHITDFSTSQQEVEVLQHDRPMFVVVLPDASFFPDLTSFLNDNYGVVDNIDGAKVWKLLKPSIREIITN
jgi:hypothetical protein